MTQIYKKLIIFVAITGLCNAQNSTFLMPWYFVNVDGVNHYILDKDLVHYQYVGDPDIFVNPYNTSIVHLDEDRLLGFTIDPSWNKLVYGDYIGEQWMKITGRWGTDNGGWYHPRSISTDGLGNLYVADADNGRIVKLQYNYSNEEIDPNYFSTIGEGLLDRPWDLDVDDRGNTSSSDDVIWVVDNGAEKIVPLTLSGSVWQNKTITSLYYNGTFYNDLTGMCGVAIRKQSPSSPSDIGVNSTTSARIYLVDWKLRKLFLVEVNSIGAIDEGIGIVSYEKTFASDVVLSGVESDYFGDIWVVNNSGNRIYKYTWDGQWLDQITGLNYPTSVASVRRHHLNIAITERWTNTTGNRTYYHGANIRDLSISTSTTTANFDFRLTNYSYLEAKIYKGTTEKATLEDGSELKPSGNMSLNWYQSNPAGGNYTLKLWAKAYHDQNIYKYTYQTFTFSLAATISGPNSLMEREEGTWNANTTGGGSSADHQWYYKYDNSETWRSTDSTNSSYSRIMGREGFTVKVVVTSNGETDNATKHVAYVGGIPEKKEFVLPKEYDLTQNYPNPFNPLTAIKYDLPEESMVVLKIYELMGREVRTLVKGIESAGFKKVLWDGKNTYGKPVSSGVYLYRLDAVSRVSSKDFHETRKLVLLR